MEVSGAGDMDMTMVDGIIYMRSEAMSGDKYWKIDPSDPDSPWGQMGMDKLLEQSDPISGLEAMKDGIDTVTFEGTEDVDGRELDHYVLSIDMEAAMGNIGTDLPDAAKEAMPESVTYDLWLDDQDRFSEMKMEIPVLGKSMDMEMSVDDWGKDVSIEAPPADQVTDMPGMEDLMGGMSRGTMS